MGDNHEVAEGDQKSEPGAVDAGGILAANLLHAYDVDFDFASKKFNLLSQKHCDGKVVYWPADAVAAIPITLDSDGHIIVPVTLDGHQLRAMVDSGATGSLLNLEEAKSYFGITPGSADTPVIGSLTGTKGSSTYKHRFSSLALEGLAIGNPTLALIPDLMHNRLGSDQGSSVASGSRIRDPNASAGLGDMILGMDILHKLHVYIAYKEKMLYITPAAPAQPVATQAPVASSSTAPK
jgi:hypothetical protein